MLSESPEQWCSEYLKATPGKVTELLVRKLMCTPMCFNHSGFAHLVLPHPATEINRVTQHTEEPWPTAESQEVTFSSHLLLGFSSQIPS
jgi:hypothetical protein